MKRLVVSVLVVVFLLALVLPAAAVPDEDANSIHIRLEQQARVSYDQEIPGQGNAYGWQNRFTVNERVYQYDDCAPVIKEGRILVPLRAVSQALGAIVEWDGDTETVTITMEDAKLTITVEDTTVIIERAGEDPEEVNLDVSAKFSSNGRVAVPLRFIAEALGYDVNWDAELGASLSKKDKTDDDADDDDQDEDDGDEDDTDDGNSEEE